MRKPNEFRLPKNSPLLRPVNPEHLALGFHVACGVVTGKMASEGIGENRVVVEEEYRDPLIDAALDEMRRVGAITGTDNSTFSLADTPYLRMMMAISKELEPFYPSTSTEENVAIAAIQERVTALLSHEWGFLSTQVLSSRVQRRDNETFFLGPKVLLALARAPLEGVNSEYEEKTFLKVLSSVIVPRHLRGLTLELPAEWVKR